MKYQKHGINWITSWLFLVNIIHAYFRKAHLIMWGSFFCLVTSLHYHSTYSNEGLFIDKFTHALWGSMSLLISYSWVSYYAFSILNTIGISTAYYCTGHSHCPKRGIINHSILHILGCLGIAFCIEAYHFLIPKL